MFVVPTLETYLILDSLTSNTWSSAPLFFISFIPYFLISNKILLYIEYIMKRHSFNSLYFLLLLQSDVLFLCIWLFSNSKKKKKKKKSRLFILFYLFYKNPISFFSRSHCTKCGVFNLENWKLHFLCSVFFFLYVFYHPFLVCVVTDTLWVLRFIKCLHIF